MKCSAGVVVIVIYLFFPRSLIEFSCHKRKLKYPFRVDCVHGYHTVVFSFAALFAEFRMSETRFVQDTNVNTPIHTVRMSHRG